MAKLARTSGSVDAVVRSASPEERRRGGRRPCRGARLVVVVVAVVVSELIETSDKWQFSFTRRIYTSVPNIKTTRFTVGVQLDSALPFCARARARRVVVVVF